MNAHAFLLRNAAAWRGDDRLAGVPAANTALAWQDMVVERKYPIEIPYEAIAEFCRRNHIRKLSLFGSVLRDDFTPESDVDVLVEFEEGKTPGLAYFGMGTELEPIFGREVDVVTPNGLSKYYRDEVLAEAEPIYVAA